MPISDEQLEEWFRHHEPNGDQKNRFAALRDAGLALAEVISEATPPGADQMAAIRKVREAVMTAIAATAAEKQ